MKLREALIQQAPSLALQRAAADEIAWLDAAVERLTREQEVAYELLEVLQDLLSFDNGEPEFVAARAVVAKATAAPSSAQPEDYREDGQIEPLVRAIESAARAPLLADERDEEIERLRDLVIRQGTQLRRIVNIVRGDPAEGCAHSTHDAADLVYDLKMHSDQYAMAVEHEQRAAQPVADELRIARGAIRELEAKVFSQEQALTVLRSSVDSYHRDMADPPGYLQDAVIRAAGLGAMAEQIAALKKAQPVRQPLTQAQVDAIVNASREAGEGPSALVRRVERAVLAAAATPKGGA